MLETEFLLFQLKTQPKPFLIRRLENLNRRLCKEKKKFPVCTTFIPQIPMPQFSGTAGGSWVLYTGVSGGEELLRQQEAEGRGRKQFH